MLKLRLITALVLIVTLLLIVNCAPWWGFVIITTAMVSAGVWEWANLIGLRAVWAKMFYLLLFFFVVNLCFVFKLSLLILLVLSNLFWVVAWFLVISYPKYNKWQNYLLIKGLVGILVLLPGLFFINAIFLLSHPTMVMFILALIALADSSAYFAGKLWGRTPLLPEVSPGKTWVGVYAALGVTTLFTLLILLALNTGLGGTMVSIIIPYTLWPLVVLAAALTVVYSIVGDLFESMIKRHAGVKDSGALLPGHGGILDRIDGFTAAVPIFSAGVYLITVLNQYLN